MKKRLLYLYNLDQDKTLKIFRISTQTVKTCLPAESGKTISSSVGTDSVGPQVIKVDFMSCLSNTVLN